MKLIPVIINNYSEKPFNIYGIYLIYKESIYQHSTYSRGIVLNHWDPLENNYAFKNILLGEYLDNLSPFGRYCEKNPQGIEEYLKKL